MAPMQFYLFLPQMRMGIEDLVGRAQAAETAGFAGVAGMDHLFPPLAEDSPMYEAMIVNALQASRTDRLRVGSLVLCDSFRHPAVLAREAVTLDHASGGRFDLGLGWGSVPTELDVFGIGSTEPRARVGRLKESLEIIRALWKGETVDYAGEYFTLKGARQSPTPIGEIPIVIGGAGPKTMELVAAHADWWNVHVGILDRLQPMRAHAGNARVSLQVRTAYVHSEDTRAETTAAAQRRFGPDINAGSGPELVDYFSSLSGQGVERVYVWFCDFAPARTLEAFGAAVIAHFE